MFEYLCGISSDIESLSQGTVTHVGRTIARTERSIAAEANQLQGESAGKPIGLPRDSGAYLGKYGSKRLLRLLLRAYAAENILGNGA